MKNPIEVTSELEVIIRDLHKISSKLLSGQFIYANRDVGRLIAYFEKKKQEVIQSSISELTVEEESR